LTELEQLLARAAILREQDPEGLELPSVVNAINVIRAAEAPDSFEAWKRSLESDEGAKRVPIVQQLPSGPRRGRPPRHG
jgi:hypothetical protein